MNNSKDSNVSKANEEVKSNSSDVKSYIQSNGGPLFIIGLVIVIFARAVSEWFSNFYIMNLSSEGVDFLKMSFIMYGTFISLLITGILISVLGIVFIVLSHKSSK